MKRVLSILLTLLLVVGTFASFGTPAAASGGDAPNIERKLDIGIKLREMDNNPDFINQALETIKGNAAQVNFTENETNSSESQNATSAVVGEEKYFLGIELEFIKFTLRSVGPNVEVWVANDLSYGYDKPADVVTQEQADMIRDEFESSIYPTDTGFFGNENFHDGSNSVLEALGYVPEGYYHNEEGKKIILVENIKDESYYGPTPFYIAGFYWGTLETYIDRNIITIDTNRWDALMPNDNPDYQEYQYNVFGTVAHEFQHLIHADNDSMEETWINEGMSDFAEYLCGYGHPWGHVNYFLDHPENSLVYWGDYDKTEVLADYGQAYLMQLYLNDKYGQEFIRALAKDTDQGFVSMEKILNQFDTGIDFEELFRRFSIAVAIDDEQWKGGIYGFDSIDIQINYESAKLFEKDGVPAWGGNYKVLDVTDKINTISFDGIDFIPSPWMVVDDPLGSGEKVFWGNEGDEKANQTIFKADLSNVESATLKFDNFIDIEEHWDFGMVQVSTDNGETWTSLANENTTSDIVPEGYPAIIENLPGFTGHYDDWVKEEFDLTPYVGQEILINFNYMTDWGTNESGWFIDNIEIPEINYSNDCSSLEGFYGINEIKGIYVEYAVSFINERTIGNGKTNYQVVNVEPFNVTEEDALELRQLFKDGTNYMIIWYAAPDGVKDSVEFTYEIKTKKDNKKNK